MKVVIINGPMSSGKDEICKYLTHKGKHVVHMQVKEFLFQAAVASAGISRKLWDALYEREYKEIPCPYLRINGYDVSPREWMIHTSESVMKPLFGKAVFGNAAANNLKKYKEDALDSDSETVVVFSDGGFIEEMEPLWDVCGEENFYLVRLHRLDENQKEFGWGNDSRAYVHLPSDCECHQGDFYNHPNLMLDCAEEIWEWVGE